MSDIDVREIRKKLGLTQLAFAKKIGVSRDTIINYEKGETIPASKIEMLNNLLLNKKDVSILEIIEPQQGVPYYDLDFTAGFLEVTNNQGTKPDSYINHPFFKGCDYVVRASGQSMAKVISHGDAIGLIKLNNWQDFFPFGEIYAIVTNDNFRMIKVITQGDSEEHYTLISKPTDGKKDEFPPQQIKKSSISAIFRVQASSHLF
jgi:DNA-binding XRE family transcriptional regulator